MADKSALIVVDVQNDFLPGGSLGVPAGHDILPVINQYIERFARAGRPVIATRDWHPPVTKHFKEYGGVWPVHCLIDSPGGAFHPELRLPADAIIVSKGMDPESDSYSAFHAQDEQGRPLAEILRDLGVDHLYVGGLATDYCVKFSVQDAARQGLHATVLLDAIRGVNLQPHDAEEAIADMAEAGADFATLNRLAVA